MFIMLIPIAFMSSISAFVAQNVGAGKLDRAKKSMYYAMITSLIFGVFMFCVSFWFGNSLAGIFSNDMQVIYASAEYMKAYAIDCVLVCVLFCYMGYFNGCGKTMFVMVQSIIASFLIRIPFSYFMSKMPGVTLLQIGFASPVATVFAVISSVVYFNKCNKKDIATETEFKSISISKAEL